jgi:hypothetical protein
MFYIVHICVIYFSYLNKLVWQPPPLYTLFKFELPFIEINLLQEWKFHN